MLGCDLEARRLDCSPSSRSVIGEDVDIPPPFSAAQVSAHPVDIHSRGRDCIKEGQRGTVAIGYDDSEVGFHSRAPFRSCDHLLEATFDSGPPAWPDLTLTIDYG